MGNCQQKFLTTLSLGIVFSLSSAVSAKAATVAYNPILNGDNNPSFDFVEDSGGLFSSYTLGFQFSVNSTPPTNNNNQEITALGVYARPDVFPFDPLNPPTNAIPNPGPFDNPDFVYLPDTEHHIALWEVNENGVPMDIDPDTLLPIPVRRILLQPMVDDPDSDNPDDLIINPLLGFIYDGENPEQNYGFAYLALEDPLTLSGSEQFFRMGVSYINDADQAWINSDDTGQALFLGDVIVPTEDLETPPGPGAALEPMVVLQPNLAGGGQPQGYYALQDDPTGDPLLFPRLPDQPQEPGDSDFIPFPSFNGETSPFFAAGNVLFGPLDGFTTTTTGTTATGTTATGTTATGTGPGGVPTIPEPNLIHGLLAIALGGITHSARQKEKGKSR
ncbi:histidinol dehydrogenase [Crocosphaera sp.]|uniref:histidinol dehydrogenase n=1 Tax=Crocosphaera sp. TaxID=2729996 RepID=UPI003F1ECCA2|nr:histidinol dehydrogenase [Crocosphaera sp.]